MTRRGYSLEERHANDLKTYSISARFRVGLVLPSPGAGRLIVAGSRISRMPRPSGCGVIVSGAAAVRSAAKRLFASRRSPPPPRKIDVRDATGRRGIGQSAKRRRGGQSYRAPFERAPTLVRVGGGDSGAARKTHGGKVRRVRFGHVPRRERDKEAGR